MWQRGDKEKGRAEVCNYKEGERINESASLHLNNATGKLANTYRGQGVSFKQS